MASASDHVPVNTFPIKTIPQLLGELNETLPSLGFKEDDFRRPLRERWEIFFTMIVSAVFEVSPDNLRYAPPALKYPDLQNQAIVLFNLTAAMKRMLRAMGMENTEGDAFCIGDITHPASKRLIKICSAIVNFLPFARGRDEQLNEIRQEKQAEIEEYLKYQRNIDELQQKINTHTRRKAERQPEIDKINAALVEKSAYCDALMSKASDLKKQRDEKKTANAELGAQTASVKEKVAHAKDKNNRLANMIVPSPNRIKSEMDHKKQQLQNLIDLKEEKMLRLGELNKIKQSLRETVETCESGLKIITNCKQHIDSEKQNQQEIADIQQMAAACREQLWETDQLLQQSTRMKVTKAEKMDKMNLQFGERLSDKKSAIEQSTQEIEHLQLSQNDDQARKTALREDAKVMEAEEKKSIELYNHQMQILQSKYRELGQALDAYHLRLSRGSRNMLDKFDE